MGERTSGEIGTTSEKMRRERARGGGTSKTFGTDDVLGRKSNLVMNGSD